MFVPKLRCERGFTGAGFAANEVECGGMIHGEIANLSKRRVSVATDSPR